MKPRLALLALILTLAWLSAWTRPARPDAPEARARAALALALARHAPCRCGPACPCAKGAGCDCVRPAGPPAKACPCSGRCTCGCNAGWECLCTAPARLITAPAFDPPPRVLRGCPGGR